jgi:DNA (cytosine-5)-methyltransferase 1
MSRRRPTAFEVSFPEEVKLDEALKKKREADEKEKKRLEAILAAQQVDPKKLKRLEREKQRRGEKGGQKGDSLLKKRHVEEIRDAEMEVMPPRVSAKTLHIVCGV